MLKSIFQKYFKLNNIVNFFLIIFSIYLIFQRYPTCRDAFGLEGQIPQSTEVKTLNGQILRIPEEIHKPAILVFWASWCGPCKVELNRYNQAIINKEIPSENFYAINTGEELSTILQVQKEKNYQFQMFVDSSGVASQFYKVNATPTVVHIDENGKIVWVGLGVSPTALMRAKKLFYK